jgi:hypothetical protein
MSIFSCAKNIAVLKTFAAHNYFACMGLFSNQNQWVSQFSRIIDLYLLFFVNEIHWKHYNECQFSLEMFCAKKIRVGENYWLQFAVQLFAWMGQSELVNQTILYKWLTLAFAFWKGKSLERNT